MNLAEILQAAIQQDASDIVLKDGMPPMFRVRQELAPCHAAPSLSVDDLQTFMNQILSDDEHRLRFATDRQADLAFDQADVGRFRVNLFRQRGSPPR